MRLTDTRLLDLAILALTAAALAGLGLVGGYTQFVFGLVAIWTILCTGLNVLFGLTGLVSLGQVGFFAIGAYAHAILMQAGLSFWLALPLGTLIAAAVGCLLAVPAVRMAGPFLAMVTIAFAFIVEHLAIEWRGLTGGQNGLMGFDAPSLLGTTFGERELVMLAIVLAGILLLGYRRLTASGWGMGMAALRDQEIAASSLGFNPFLTKLSAFAIAAGTAGLAGGLFASLMQFIAPSNFMLSQSILFLFAVILGGAGTVLGPVVGAAIVVFLPEALSGMSEYRLLVFGALLIAVMLIAPRGVVGTIAGFLPRREAKAGACDQETVLRYISPEMPHPLTVTDLGITFGGVKAVAGASFTAAPGEVTSVIGPNGAGKTTLLNMISGFYTPGSGRIETAGTEIAGWPMHATSRLGVARTFQATRLFGSLGAEANVISAFPKGRFGAPFATLANEERRALALGLLELVGFTGDAATPAADLPHVDRRLVEIARALALRPHVLLLDEPAAGLMHADKMTLAALLRRIADLGIAVVLVEHDMDMVMGISDRILAMDAGVPIAFDTPESIRANPQVIAAYLGEGTLQAPPRMLAFEPGAMDTLITRDLRAGYGAADVLQGLNIRVRRGELVALLGANGAGKSTFLKVLSGLLAPSSGQVLMNDAYVQGLAPHRMVEHGLALVPEGRQVFPELTVAQNIELGAYRRKTRPAPEELEAILRRFPRLRDRLDTPAGLLSGGEQQMMAIARGLMAAPKLLLLDEPSLGLAPAMTEELYRILAELRDDGITILLVDQMATLALAVADRGYVLEQGRVVAEGSAEELRRDTALIEAYLGQGEARDEIQAEAAQ
ncbi:branched-chain amino acid ABC transporter ATP-binding protein/permease [Alloyangia pacifica]|uniref:Monosaccharide ABC transporter ATP-binding protein, CUT2 family (TC 3.A.1.2.-) n=1 Tax=Alloyangia pacifica TaxID=311180 RepID=A0A1I6WAC0_9RHOB|nr:branched-chain amino acid ABC transporter ATP-binding protein/permease [Alloyangia pacifica]SDI50920.1 monosaccharide ABC transporter ATP-binding protein, CUT2 family [Alloyangia pacifica]SFT22947.1 monosaccharide ABC transporter ATP-binding protein, CUT2 family (TC 3.A.1.2.-) [Alloyangia pacifica]